MPGTLTLVVPGLASLLETAPASFRDTVPCLDLLLARADREPVTDCSSATGLPVTLPAALAEWPVAPLRRLGEDGALPGAPWYCCADPVHLVAAGDHMRMVAGTGLALGASDARELAAALEPALDGGEYRLDAPGAQRWYLRGGAHARCSEQAPDTLAGMDVFPFLPADAGLRRLLTECQMLLHDHPVNRRREARGLPPVNSLWVWGGGGMPPAPGPIDLPALWTDSVWLRGVWRHAGSAAHEAPRDAAILLRENPPAALVVLAALHPDGSGGEAVQGFESGWASALAPALRKGILRELRIAPGDGTQWVLRRRALLRFWRRRVSF